VNIKPDENLPHQLVQLLTDLGHDVDTVDVLRRVATHSRRLIALVHAPAARRTNTERILI
jgi:hypothetical protein